MLVAVFLLVVGAQPKTVAHPIDVAFRNYQVKLPEPVTLSDSNGFSLECKHHHSPTLNLLRSLGLAMPIERDADLLRLVPWARHADQCLRIIALQALLPRISYDQNALSAPNFSDPEHFQFHDIMVRSPAPLRSERWRSTRRPSRSVR